MKPTNRCPDSRRFAVMAVWVTASLFAFPPARATTVIPPDFNQLVNESDYVVRAVVKSVVSEFRPTMDGKGRKIMTRVELDIKEVVAGKPPATVVLEMLGGRVGEEELRVEGAPTFKVGDEDILFVSGNGRNFHPLFAIMHGRYPILREPGTNREFVARSNKVPLHDVAEVALPVAEGPALQMQQRLKRTADALTPAQFTQLIRSAVNPNYQRARVE